jgi:predicted MFS family arabinose efflux permease
MSSDHGPFHNYLEVLRRPGVAVPVSGTALASLPIGMLGLAVLLLVNTEQSGFGRAGAVVALLGAGTGIGIAVQGRLMDRFGPPRVLLGSVSIQALSLGALVLTLHRHGPQWLVGATAFAAGLGEPQVGGALRALWPGLVTLRQRVVAAALSSIVFELPVVSGPLILAAALLVMSPEATVLMAGGLFLSGAGVLAASHAARQWKPADPTATGVLGPLVSGRVRRVVMVAAAQGVATGLLQVSCAALAAQRHQTSAAGLLYATLSVGSLLGTFLYGQRSWPGNQGRHLVLLTSLPVPVLLAAAAAGNLLSLAPCVLLVGLCLGPVAVCCFLEAEQATPAGTVVAAFTSLTAVGLMATAGGTALAGDLVDRYGTGPALLVAAGCMALASAVMAARRAAT